MPISEETSATVKIQAHFTLTKHPNTAYITVYSHLQVAELAFPLPGSGSFTTLTFYVHKHTHTHTYIMPKERSFRGKRSETDHRSQGKKVEEKDCKRVG